MKTASIFCSPISFCALAMRALRSSTVIGTMPAVIGFKAAISGGVPSDPDADTAPLVATPLPQPTATAAPAPSAVTSRNCRLLMDTQDLRGQDSNWTEAQTQCHGVMGSLG